MKFIRLLFFVMLIFKIGSMSLLSQNPESVKLPTSKRVALVIGNSNYRISPLTNPSNDAMDIAEILKIKDFEVILKIDANKQTMENAIREFGMTIAKDDVGLFYYAGHSIQLNGVNYLIPVDSNIQDEDEIKNKAIAAGTVLTTMENIGNGMNIIILDSCRDNPFSGSFKLNSIGLAPMDAQQGTYIVCANGPGKIAADRIERNSVFTKYLLKELKISDQEIGSIISEVRRSVIKETNGVQIPWESSSIMRGFYFSKVDKTFSPPNRNKIVFADQYASIALRSDPQKVKESDAIIMLQNNGFFDLIWTKIKIHKNNYELKNILKNNVVIDYSTRLMWLQAGSEKTVSYKDTTSWINKFNSKTFASYSDWRLPTLEEAASLLEKSSKEINIPIYLNPKFSTEQTEIWTSDTFGTDEVWVINFKNGIIGRYSMNNKLFLRLVRSISE